MGVIGMILMVIGFIVVLVGGVMFLIAAFQESVLWGLGCLFLSFPVSLIFLVMHWDKGGRPFLIQLAGAVPMAIGSFLAGAGAA